MTLITKGEIIISFDLLNKSNLNYILLRNIDNELPDNLQVGKDIDVLVNKKDESKFNHFFIKNGYVKIEHPFRNDTFLYGVDKFEFHYNNDNNILFDLNFQIAVRSLDAGQWIPLDQEIQESVWRNKRFEQRDDNFGYWTMSYEDELLTLITRSVFDKKQFQKGYINRINQLLSLVKFNEISFKLEKVFFKSAPFILTKIKNQEFETIVKDYLEFKDY
jgi:hypothetical protein